MIQVNLLDPCILILFDVGTDLKVSDLHFGHTQENIVRSDNVDESKNWTLIYSGQ